MSGAARAGAADNNVESAPEARGKRPSPFRVRSLLLASHDTLGARAAEEAAFDAVEPGGRLLHLVIIPEFWRSMTGDGWRINASTEHAFCDYLEGQIDAEIREHLRRVHARAQSYGIDYSARSEVGPLAETLIRVANAGAFELVMIGAPRPRKASGFRSRMDLTALARGLKVPLAVIPLANSPS
ncbi:MAG: universal stress protein [Hyphomicrobiaceae bacterium]|nr:MAG: universal stress protein [Hyphomicrobiaceae bacterium]